MPKIVDAYQRPSRHDRGFGSIYCASLGGSAGDPAAPCEPDDRWRRLRRQQLPIRQVSLPQEVPFCPPSSFRREAGVSLSVTRHPPDNSLTEDESDPVAARWQASGVAVPCRCASGRGGSQSRSAYCRIFCHRDARLPWFSWNAQQRAPHAVDVTGGNRNSAISRTMSANRFLGIATSAIRKATQQPWLTTFAPICMAACVESLDCNFLQQVRTSLPNDVACSIPASRNRPTREAPNA